MSDQAFALLLTVVLMVMMITWVPFLEVLTRRRTPFRNASPASATADSLDSKFLPGVAAENAAVEAAEL